MASRYTESWPHCRTLPFSGRRPGLDNHSHLLGGRRFRVDQNAAAHSLGKRTPHYFPFAFTYRDYVVAAFNADKPFDQFIREQFAADLMDLSPDAPELAALGFLTVGPHANRDQPEAIDDWIDITTRGLMGMTVACARCHDHKYEPIPTPDYYALHGVFSSIIPIDPLDDSKQPLVAGYVASEQDKSDYSKRRAAIDDKIAGSAGKKPDGLRPQAANVSLFGSRLSADGYPRTSCQRFVRPAIHVAFCRNLAAPMRGPGTGL